MRGVVTPDAVVLEFEIAGVASRSLAQIVDLGVRFGLLYALAIVAAAFGTASNSTPAIVLLFVGLFLIVFGYPAILEARWNGQTVGKRVLGLRVVTVEGAPVRFRHASIRSLLQVVDFFLPPVGVSATCVALLNRRNQRLGDVFAGTIVLRERTGAAFPVPVSFPPMHGFELYARSLDVGGVSPEQYAVVRSFLLRVAILTPAARSHLGIRLANVVALSMHHTPPAQVTPETFLVSVAAAYQLRQGGPPVPLPPWVPQWGMAPAPARMAP
ncbi:MAG: hypothetical protein QOI95_1606 [Acidimicrobiaceae bacterium]